MWQRLYEELRDDGFVVIAVALDSRGAEAARPWIEQARPSYPCVIDRQHRVAELYGMVNVPQAVWIDESGRIVRPTETAATTDAFRAMDRRSFRLPEPARAELKQARRLYLDAVRDWVKKGTASEFAWSEKERRERLALPDDTIAAAHAHFRLGLHLLERGKHDEGDAFLRAAVRLHPESWSYWRQRANLEDVAKSGGPEFWARVDALGERRYYAPIAMKGMPG